MHFTNLQQFLFGLKPGYTKLLCYAHTGASTPSHWQTGPGATQAGQLSEAHWPGSKREHRALARVPGDGEHGRGV